MRIPKYISTKIYLNEKRTRYCIVKLFRYLKDMQKYFKKVRPKMKQWYNTLGAHLAYYKYNQTKTGWRMARETGTVLLSLAHTGAGVVTHELLHAVLWSWKLKKGHPQYPIIIVGMQDEEELLLNHTRAVKQFYNWFYKMEKIKHAFFK